MGFIFNGWDRLNVGSFLGELTEVSQGLIGEVAVLPFWCRVGEVGGVGVCLCVFYVCMCGWMDRQTDRRMDVHINTLSVETRGLHLIFSSILFKIYFYRF